MSIKHRSKKNRWTQGCIAGITVATSEIKKFQKESAFKIKKKDFEIFLGLYEALSIKIIEAVDEQFITITALDKDLIGYAGSTPPEMIMHLRDSACKISNHDKIQLKEIFMKNAGIPRNISPLIPVS